jgi:hypothetical protein
MNDDKDFSGPKVFKLISGEEIVATINRTTDNQFLIEMPLEIKYNPDDSSVYLTKWCLGTDYTTVMTLSSHSIISAGTPSDVVYDNYKKFTEVVLKGGLDNDIDDDSITDNDVELVSKTPTLH